ncbi:alpha/beta hydrolase [Periweissella cryptocerci]|uniref:Alpha/beta hydrolase n=1 Tax=Periweissella cryptocerci TaxID=2506420 RepID=A0A4P6YU93_9LACO|nr:alpha/beta hydrolase [Periweissella cryptocerci]QBO36300.1 alpha/beta hydrolase [Periweissella cryptocerci]
MKFIERDYQFEPADVSGIDKQYHDVAYMAGSRHTLDIYYPNVPRETYPVIIDIYGGGLYFGEKSSHKLQNSLALTEAGYVVVSPNYSLIWQAPFPTQIYEMKAVIRWVRAQAKQYQFDPERIVLSGESSGAHLAVLTAATASVNKMWSDFGDYLTVDDTVAAVIASYGPYEFDTFAAQFAVLGIDNKYAETGTAGSFEGQMFNQRAPKDVPELIREYNPATYFTPAMPPLMLLAGTADKVVPVLQSQNLAVQALNSMDAKKVTWRWINDANHGPKDFATPAIYEYKRNWLANWLA